RFLTLCAHGLNDLYNENLLNEHEEHRHDDGPIGRAPNPFGTFGRMVALVTAHNADGESENNCLQNQRKHIEEGYRIKYLVEIHPEAGIFYLIDTEECAQQAYCSRIA